MSTPDRLHPDAPVADLQAWWMPFTHNRLFKDRPRLITGAQGAYYTLADGRRVFDGLSGLWCSPLGHSPPRVVEAVQRQVASLDFCPGFQLGHPAAFSLAARIARFADRPRDRVFFVNSGSEAVDTALKIAVAYHRARGEASRTRIIGRERAYHGVGIGGISVGGIAANRKTFAPLMIPGVDHLPHTWDPAHMRYSRGQPTWGAHLADELERLVALHDASNIAAVIVEPMQGSTGVVVPPRGYLEKLREICTRHGILLIFDEVMSGAGRTGRFLAAEHWPDARPDMVTLAKGVAAGYTPLGMVLTSREMVQTVVEAGGFLHGHTYSANPLSCAIGEAVLREVMEQDLIGNAERMGVLLGERLQALAESSPIVGDVRGLGLLRAIEIVADKTTKTAFPPSRKSIARIVELGLEKGLLLYSRSTAGGRYGEWLMITPPLILTEPQLDEMMALLTEVLAAFAAEALA